MRLLSFDIEISDVFDLAEGEEIDAYAPFHISVAATAIEGGEELVWYSQDESGRPLQDMTAERARELLLYLEAKQAEGYHVCAWNGLGFDLRWIGHNAGDFELAARIARKSYDPMFQFFNLAGFPVGLAKVARAMGISQEKLMDGADAPAQWRDGAHQLVMDYCLGDCQMTNQVIRAIHQAGEVRWHTARGTISSKPMPTLLTVADVLALPGPDQSWMTTPLLKEKFHAWMPPVGPSSPQPPSPPPSPGTSVQGELFS